MKKEDEEKIISQTADAFGLTFENVKRLTHEAVNLIEMPLYEALRTIKDRYNGQEILFVMFVYGQSTNMNMIRARITAVDPMLFKMFMDVIKNGVNIHVVEMDLDSTDDSSFPFHPKPPLRKEDIN